MGKGTRAQAEKIRCAIIADGSAALEVKRLPSLISKEMDDDAVSALQLPAGEMHPAAGGLKYAHASCALQDGICKRKLSGICGFGKRNAEFSDAPFVDVRSENRLNFLLRRLGKPENPSNHLEKNALHDHYDCGRIAGQADESGVRQ